MAGVPRKQVAKPRRKTSAMFTCRISRSRSNAHSHRDYRDIEIEIARAQPPIAKQRLFGFSRYSAQARRGFAPRAFWGIAHRTCGLPFLVLLHFCMCEYTKNEQKREVISWRFLFILYCCIGLRNWGHRSKTSEQKDGPTDYASNELERRRSVATRIETERQHQSYILQMDNCSGWPAWYVHMAFRFHILLCLHQFSI